MVRARKYCILTAFALLPLCSVAQNLDKDTIQLHEVTIKAERSIENFGMHTYHLDSMQIEQSLDTELSEVLERQSHVFVKKSIKGGIASVSLRGAQASHTGVIWNGIPLNSPMHGGVDMSLIPINFTDAVSILYSGASMSSANSELGGTIQMHSHSQWGKGFSMQLMSSAGSYGSLDEALNLNYSTKNLSLSTRAFYSQAENDFLYENSDIIEGPEMQRENADFTAYGIMQSLNWHPLEQHFLGIDVWGQESERGVPGLSTNESGVKNNISRQKDHQLRAALKWKIYSGTWVLNMHSAMDYQLTDFRTKNYISGLGAFTSIRSESDALSWHNRFSAKWSISGADDLKIRLRHRAAKVDMNEIISGNSFVADRQDFYINLDHEHVFSENWYTHLIFREDIIGGKAYLPCFAINSACLLAERFSVALDISRDTHHPTLNDLYYVPGGNSELLPEKAMHISGGISFSLINSFSWTHELHTYFRNVQDWIIWRPAPQGYWEPDNIAEVRSAGLEYQSNFRKEWKAWAFYTRLSYAYTRSVDVSGGAYQLFDEAGQIPYTPIHALSIHSALAYKAWEIKYQWNYYSERYTTSQNQPDILYTMYPYYMNDLLAGKSVRLKDLKIAINLGVYNLFDESYRSVLWQPMPGRNYRVSIKINFK